MNPKPLGACIFCFNRQGQLLIVNRPKNPNSFCLPGGKIEGREKIVDGAIRELKEEAGVLTQRYGLLEVFRDHCNADDDLGVDGYDVTCFLSVRIEDEAKKGQEPNITPTYGEDSIGLLLKSHTSPFASYNHRALTALLPYLEAFAEHDTKHSEHWGLALDNLKSQL